MRPAAPTRAPCTRTVPVGVKVPSAFWRARIVLGDLEQRAVQRQVAVHELVLDAGLVAFVVLRRQLLRAGRRGELLERRVERGAVRDVVGLLLRRLEDRAGADAGEVVGLELVGHRGVADRVGRVDRVAELRRIDVPAQAADQLQPGHDLDRVVEIGAQPPGLGRLVVARNRRHVARRAGADGEARRRAADRAGHQRDAVAGAGARLTSCWCTARS